MKVSPAAAPLLALGLKPMTGWLTLAVVPLVVAGVYLLLHRVPCGGDSRQIRAHVVGERSRVRGRFRAMVLQLRSAGSSGRRLSVSSRIPRETHDPLGVFRADVLARPVPWQDRRKWEGQADRGCGEPHAVRRGRGSGRHYPGMGRTRGRTKKPREGEEENGRKGATSGWIGRRG